MAPFVRASSLVDFACRLDMIPLYPFFLIYSQLTLFWHVVWVSKVYYDHYYMGESATIYKKGIKTGRRGQRGCGPDGAHNLKKKKTI